MFFHKNKQKCQPYLGFDHHEMKKNTLPMYLTFENKQILIIFNAFNFFHLMLFKFLFILCNNKDCKNNKHITITSSFSQKEKKQWKKKSPEK